MKKTIYIYIIMCSFMLMISCSMNSTEIYKVISNKNFSDIIQDAEFAISENNFRIVNRINIGDSIQKRNGDTFPRNEIILFCNLTIAEEMLKLDPDYINYCPYKITITEDEEIVFIGTRLLPTNTRSSNINNFSIKMNEILRNMVKYASSEDPFIFDLDK